MSRDKQTEIEEIVQDVDKAIRANFAWDVLAGGYIVSRADNIAQELCYKGYRKASDVAEEIFELIDCAFSPVLVYNGYTVKEYLAELKKKYTESEKDK